VLPWVTQTLVRNRETGASSATLKLGRPLDGDSTVGGVFDGPAKVAMTWSLVQVPLTPGDPQGQAAPEPPQMPEPSGEPEKSP